MQRHYPQGLRRKIFVLLGLVMALLPGTFSYRMVNAHCDVCYKQMQISWLLTGLYECLLPSEFELIVLLFSSGMCVSSGILYERVYLHAYVCMGLWDAVV